MQNLFLKMALNFDFQNIFFSLEIKKFEHIEKLRPDIVILQECEKLDQNYFPNSKYFSLMK